VPSNSPSPSANPQPSNTTAPANIKAGPGDGKTALRLIGSGIVNKYNSYKDKIITDDTEKGSVTFMIPVNIVNLGTGTLTINDDLVKSVTTFTSAKNSFITIEKTNPDVKLEIIAGSGPDELYVSVASVMAPVSGSKVVVLDPGHGGKDPGAVFNGCKEKDYNLDISLRCEAILKSKGVNVHMTRSTDVYVSLEDRYKFANDLNATLFVSIHNNSMPNGMKGSMLLYHYTSYKGKAYATIMLNNLVKDLKTGNLGLSARTKTKVLKYTKMPAILAEVACMSHPDDLALLNTDAFIQKAAESLAESIIQILSS
jgi:N-acetylmuramoyl-L-alanine amidase